MASPKKATSSNSKKTGKSSAARAGSGSLGKSAKAKSTAKPAAKSAAKAPAKKAAAKPALKKASSTKSKSPAPAKSGGKSGGQTAKAVKPVVKVASKVPSGTAAKAEVKRTSRARPAKMTTHGIVERPNLPRPRPSKVHQPSPAAQVALARPDGFEIGVSRTLAVSVGVAFDSFAVDKLRKAWLPEGLEITRATRPRSVRADWENDTRVDVSFYAKGEAKCQVSLQHGHLPNPSFADKMKDFWSIRMDKLQELLGAG